MGDKQKRPRFKKEKTLLLIIITIIIIKSMESVEIEFSDI